jgi:hypothetical protein
MRCWVCGGPADGVCRFCGRGICKEHVRSMPYVIAVFTGATELKGLALDDALYCGICQPRSEPISMEFLK